MRGYAVGYDRARRQRSDEEDQPSRPRLGFGVFGLALAALAVLVLASKSQTTPRGESIQQRSDARAWPQVDKEWRPADVEAKQESPFLAR